MTYQSPMSHSELMAALARVRHVALDMDGTIYLGSRLFDFTKGFLQSLTQLGIGYSFLTNNPTGRRSNVAKRRPWNRCHSRADVYHIYGDDRVYKGHNVWGTHTFCGGYAKHGG